MLYVAGSIPVATAYKGTVMRDETWREGPPPALQLMVFRQTRDFFFNVVLREIKIPAHLTLENVSDWLRKNCDMDASGKYTVLSVGTKDVFEISQERIGLVVAQVESTVY